MQNSFLTCNVLEVHTHPHCVFCFLINANFRLTMFMFLLMCVYFGFGLVSSLVLLLVDSLLCHYHVYLFQVSP